MTTVAETMLLSSSAAVLMTYSMYELFTLAGTLSGAQQFSSISVAVHTGSSALNMSAAHRAGRGRGPFRAYRKRALRPSLRVPGA